MRTTDEYAAVAAALRVEVDGWERELDALMARIGRWFARPETRRTARDGVDGLLADLPCKNGWTLAEHAGHPTPDRMQHLLSRARWDDAAVRGEVAAYVAENLAGGLDPDQVTLVFDETGDQKKGTHTVGVQRQYSGTCGRIENCQVAVYATLASPRGHAFVDAGLYLPRSWTGQTDRRAAAGVPAWVGFATKPQLALQMTDRVLEMCHARDITPPGWAAGDEVYGDNTALRVALERRGLGYVLAVSSDTKIPTPAGTTRARDLATQIPSEQWQLHSAGAGSKGERLYAWHVTAILPRPGTSDSRHRWLLVRRNLRNDELSYYLCHATTPVPASTLVGVAGTRWKIEENIQASKGCAGLDEHQVRTWTSWHRWITLVMVAHGYLAVQAAKHTPAKPHDTKHEPNPIQNQPNQTIPLTCNEIRHLRAVITKPNHDTTHTARWSLFRRKHQHRARQCHYRRRQQHHYLQL